MPDDFHQHALAAGRLAEAEAPTRRQEARTSTLNRVIAGVMIVSLIGAFMF